MLWILKGELFDSPPHSSDMFLTLYRHAQERLSHWEGADVSRVALDLRLDGAVPSSRASC